MTKEEIIITKDLAKSYTQGNQEYKIFQDVNFTINKGDMIALVGPSGSGKTSFLNILGLLDNPSSGDIFINSQNTSSLSDNEKCKIRGENIGFVFQFHYLLPDFSALENVMMPFFINKRKEKEAKEKSLELLEILGLSHRLESYPSMLSGGEAQRVAIARAVALNPSLLIADEPTGNLDSNNAKEVFNLLLNLSREKNIAVLVATHDMSLADKMSRKIKLENQLLLDIS